ncbi:hypothetical protein BDFB_012533 [Asbolus verrucosus]|uniref:Uncharacterized protein n=1 Tax=Asbolus verrucosus TaxID=1661398 RepID=A0A482W8Z5_ASBVE|nr:hypothetical protein BDFB_012533 [Asbolus verrucosus]
MSVCIIHGRKKIYLSCESCEVATHFKVLLDNHSNIVHKELEVNEDLRQLLKRYECGQCDFQTNSVMILESDPLNNDLNVSTVSMERNGNIV